VRVEGGKPDDPIARGFDRTPHRARSQHQGGGRPMKWMPGPAIVLLGYLGEHGRMNAIKLALLAAALLALGTPLARADKTEKIEELVNLHDLKTSVAVGDFYLKQQALRAVRGYLTKLGREQGLGAQWNSQNPYWKEAEDALMRSMMKDINRQFSNLEWLSEEWAVLDSREFSEADIDTLLRHMKTEVGRKQVMIVDHGVSVHVMG